MYLNCGKNYLLSRSHNKAGNMDTELLLPSGTRKLLCYTTFTSTIFADR